MAYESYYNAFQIFQVNLVSNYQIVEKHWPFFPDSTRGNLVPSRRTCACSAVCLWQRSAVWFPKCSKVGEFQCTWRWQRCAARLAVCNAGLGLGSSLLSCANLTQTNVSIWKLLVNLDVRSCKFIPKLYEVAKLRTHAFVSW